MTREEVKQLIIDLVEMVPGCKTISLCSMPQLIDNGFDIADLIDELVEEKKLIEVEYILQSMDYRRKSILFTPKTLLKIVGGGDD